MILSGLKAILGKEDPFFPDGQVQSFRDLTIGEWQFNNVSDSFLWFSMVLTMFFNNVSFLWLNRKKNGIYRLVIMAGNSRPRRGALQRGTYSSEMQDSPWPPHCGRVV